MAEKLFAVIHASVVESERSEFEAMAAASAEEPISTLETTKEKEPPSFVEPEKVPVVDVPEVQPDSSYTGNTKVVASLLTVESTVNANGNVDWTSNNVGLGVGGSDGTFEGEIESEGTTEIRGEGSLEGASDGSADGRPVDGEDEGICDEEIVGALEGAIDGEFVGSLEGAIESDGTIDARGEGLLDGTFDGTSDGGLVDGEDDGGLVDGEDDGLGEGEVVGKLPEGAIESDGTMDIKRDGLLDGAIVFDGAFDGW